MAKYIIVCGGVISGTGKGVSACSIGLLLRLRGFDVQYVKLDPYLNINAGVIRPGDHGESFVCDDGTETDLDLGYAERILGINVSKKNILTSGALHKELIEKQEIGSYLGSTLQLVPHITDLIQQRLLDVGEKSDVVIVEIGGTVGDAESYVFFEAARQFKQKYREDVLIAMVAPILWIPTIQEFKTKPLQNSVRELQKHGLQPDVLFCRVDRQVPEEILTKIASLTGIRKNCMFVASDVQSIYQVPLAFYDKHVDDLFVDLFRLNRSACRIYKYREVVEKYINNHLPGIKIGIIGKYDHPDAYISLKESLIHAGVENDVKVNINFIKSDELEKYKDNRGLHKYFDGLHGIVVPGGFDSRGTEGKIRAIQYIREKKIPFLGICLGLQCAVIEFSRNVLGLDKADSLEFNKDTPDPVIHYVEGQKDLLKKSGTMRLGSYNCELIKDSLAIEMYDNRLVKERHRHRYEVNPEYLERHEAKGLKVSGRNPDNGLVEIMELDRKLHPFFIGCQFHPEFKSRLGSPHPLFDNLIRHAVRGREEIPDEKA